MDELRIKTRLGQKLVEHLIEKAIRKSLSRKIDIIIHNIELSHKENDVFIVNLNLSAGMTEAEMNALIEQIGGN